MDSSLVSKIETLRLYLTSLPDILPLPSVEKSAYGFQIFAVDNEWVDDIGEEGAVNRELEVRLGSRANGPVELKERGMGIAALADVLDKYLTWNPTSVILQKWLSDMIISAQTVYESAQVQVSGVAK
jgi:hypothetical protein